MNLSHAEAFTQLGVLGKDAKEVRQGVICWCLELKRSKEDKDEGE